MKGSKVSRVLEGQLRPRGVFARRRAEASRRCRFRKNAVDVFASGCALRSHEGRERTTRRSPRAAADDADRRATRRSSANASRCASVASRDAPRDVRRIPRRKSVEVAKVASRSGGERARALAGNEGRGRSTHLDLEDCVLRVDLWVREGRR